MDWNFGADILDSPIIFHDPWEDYYDNLEKTKHIFDNNNLYLLDVQKQTHNYQVEIVDNNNQKQTLLERSDNSSTSNTINIPTIITKHSKDDKTVDFNENSFSQTDEKHKIDHEKHEFFVQVAQKIINELPTVTANKTTTLRTEESVKNTNPIRTKTNTSSTNNTKSNTKSEIIINNETKTLIDEIDNNDDEVCIF